MLMFFLCTVYGGGNAFIKDCIIMPYTKQLNILFSNYFVHACMHACRGGGELFLWARPSNETSSSANDSRSLARLWAT